MSSDSKPNYKVQLKTFVFPNETAEEKINQAMGSVSPDLVVHIQVDRGATNTTFYIFHAYSPTQVFGDE